MTVLKTTYVSYCPHLKWVRISLRTLLAILPQLGNMLMRLSYCIVIWKLERWSNAVFLYKMVRFCFQDTPQINVNTSTVWRRAEKLASSLCCFRNSKVISYTSKSIEVSVRSEYNHCWHPSHGQYCPLVGVTWLQTPKVMYPKSAQRLSSAFQCRWTFKVAPAAN